MLDLARFYFFAFGLMTIAGGVMGFVRAKSRPSLIAGSISGIALLVAGYFMGTATNARIGLILGLIVSLALAGRFVGAFLKSKKMMPAGLMALLGTVGVVVSAYVLFAA